MSTYASIHRWAGLLKQKLSITVYHLPIKENKFPFPFAENKQKFAVLFFVCRKTTKVAVFFVGSNFRVYQYPISVYINMMKQQHIHLYSIYAV
jgi:hypothetical protein